ncbi:hypothetical protein D3C87_1581650 [compost metagenome]
MESVSTSVNNPRSRYLRWLWIPFLPLLLPLLVLQLMALWNIYVLPSATVNYSRDAEHGLRYTWNVQDRIYRGRMSPGGATSDHGYLFPDAEFFMEFSWAAENGRWHCISIRPKWPNMHIFLDAEGNIDMRKGSGADVDRLKECQWDLAKP